MSYAPPYGFKFGSGARAFRREELDRILNFATRDRNTSFSKALCAVPMMQDGNLPMPPQAQGLS